MKHKQFQRGFQHGNSGKNPSKTSDDESMNLFSNSHWSRDISNPPTEKESIVSFLYGNKSPVKVKELTAEGKYFFKKDLVFTENEKGEKRLSYKRRNNTLEELKSQRKSLDKTFKEKHQERYKEYYDSITPGEVITYKLSSEQLNLKIQETNRKLKEKPSPESTIRHLELEKYINHDILREKYSRKV